MVPSAAILRAGCKINLFLRVTGLRDDGYHLIESLFLPLDIPADTITVKSGCKDTGLVFSCSDNTLAENNIIQSAYDIFARATSFYPDLEVHLEKNIPHGAGLGGGSSDAAALLGFLNNAARVEGRSLEQSSLTKLAVSLGADVPFFLWNKPSIVRGIGENIVPIASPVTGLYLVLVCPEIHVPTSWAFAAWDQKIAENTGSETLTNMCQEDSRPLVHGICVHNDLAPVVFECHPELGEVVQVLYAYGAKSATMSGSGSSLFGLFADMDSAEKAASFFRAEGYKVFKHIL